MLLFSSSSPAPASTPTIFLPYSSEITPMEKRISHFYTRTAKRAQMRPSPFGEPSSEAAAAGPAAGETAARAAEVAGGAMAGGAAPVEAGSVAMGAMAGVAETEVASRVAVEAGWTAAEVAEAGGDAGGGDKDGGY